MPYLKERCKSFKFAIEGLITLIQEEANARIHLIATILVILLGWYFSISTVEWFALIFSIGLVFAFEAINSSIEALADYSTTEIHHLIKKSKDLAAASVLITAIVALLVGSIIFIPKVSYSILNY